jgi:DNA-binding response OmpR family regulator
MTTSKHAMQTIVVADDDIDICDLVEMQLTRIGFRVVTAHDGGSALALIISEQPCLVILDVMMPVMSGFEVVRAIRAHTQVGKTKIVLFSAKNRGGDTSFMKEQDVDDYIAKPFSPGALVQRVLALLGVDKKKENDDK